MADRMLKAKSLRRLIDGFIVIRKAYFTRLENIAPGAIKGDIAGRSAPKPRP
jgi:hypothetical protein